MEVLMIEAACMVPAFDQHHLSCSLLGKDNNLLAQRLLRARGYTHAYAQAHPLLARLFHSWPDVSGYKTPLFSFRFTF